MGKAWAVALFVIGIFLVMPSLNLIALTVAKLDTISECERMPTCGMVDAEGDVVSLAEVRSDAMRLLWVGVAMLATGGAFGVAGFVVAVRSHQRSSGADPARVGAPPSLEIAVPQCVACSRELPAGARFCTGCGSPQTAA